MKYEKPQRGNPHRRTIKQHTFPAASISRFTNRDGTVSVYHISSKKILKLPTDNQLFCAKRNWDQRAEDGYMKEIEDKFQALADCITGGPLCVVGTNEQKIINDFFHLLVSRTDSRANPLPDQTLSGMAGLDFNLTKDQQETAGKKRYRFYSSRFYYPGQAANGSQHTEEYNQKRIRSWNKMEYFYSQHWRIHCA